MLTCGWVEFELLPRSTGSRIDASSRRSSSKVGSSTIVAGSLLTLEMSKSPGKDGPLLFAACLIKGLGSQSDREPSFSVW